MIQRAAILALADPRKIIWGAVQSSRTLQRKAYRGPFRECTALLKYESAKLVLKEQRSMQI
jgi:hypothetical protein